MTDTYDPDNTDAATLAAFQALGAEIASLRYQLAAQTERADELLRDASRLAGERDEMQRHLQQQIAENNGLRYELAQIVPTVWENVQRVMVQSGILRIERNRRTLEWIVDIGGGGDGVFIRGTLTAAANAATNAWEERSMETQP